MSRKKLSLLAIYTILSLWMITTIYPFIWVLINSFKDKDRIIVDSFSIPFQSFTLDNYVAALYGRYQLYQAYFNSLIISGSVVLIVLLISLFGSFALAKYDFRGKNAVYAILIASMMFPIFSTIFPLFRLLVNLNLQGRHLGVILPQVAGNVAFATILLSGFIRSLPKEVEESAFIDGANIFQVLFKIIVPMSKSSIASAAIFVFLWSYNDLFLQMIILTEESKMPISALLLEISSREGGTNYGLMVAAVAIIAIPMIIIYFILQKHIIKGLTSGAIKG